MSDKKSYAAPRIVRHGAAVDQTRGPCACSAECCGYKKAASLDDGIDG